MSASLSEHLPLLAGAPDGVKKLRGLILELAVRGKLVPQDPSDEPASELLKRIAAEKARLVAEGTCKKPKANPLDDAESPIFNIAPGWDSAPLGDVVDIIRGITFPSSEKSKTPEAGRVRCLRTSNVQDKIEWGDILYIRSEFVSRNDQTLCPNDIVMSMANSRELVGKVALVENQLTEPATFGGFLGVLRPHLILPRFVMAFLRAPTVRSSLIDSASQTTNIANISLAKLRPLSFPIPPLAEQHRIVAKVDELMALCDRMEAEQADAEAAHVTLVQTLLGTLTQSRDAAELAANWQRLSQHFDTLFTTEASLDALKRTILQLAVMGKLVPQDPKDEPASELLKRIAAEKARLVVEGKIKKDKLLADIETDGLYALPASWRWASLGSLVKLMDAGWSPACHETPSQDDDTWGVLKTTAVQTLKYLEHENKELPANLDPRPECEVSAGDILITRAGPKNRVAISCLVEKTRPRLIISDKIIRFHLVDGGISDKFVALCLNAGATAEHLEKSKSGMAVSQMNISQDKLRLAPIPVCSPIEQHRIVATVDKLIALCNNLKTDLAESRARQARLATTLIESALQAA